MTDFVDNLTDAELRTKLCEYGFPVVPITTTTRKVMAKKLKMLIENKNKTNSDGRRSLAKYSSEEESDDDAKSKNKRRMTVAAGMLPPVSTNKTTRKSTRKVENDNDVSSNVVTTETKTRRTTRLIKPVNEADLETGSDSEPEIVEEYNSDNYTRPYLSPRATISSVPPTPLPTSSSYSSSTTSRYTSSVLESNAGLAGGDSSAERLNQIRSRLSLGAYDRKIGGGDEPTSEAPFLSNFSKRLSQLSNSSAPKPEYNYKNDIIKEHDTNGSSAFSRSYLSRVRNRVYPQDFKSRQEKNIFKNNFVSFTLLGIVVAFFIGITIMYVGIRSDQSTVVEKTDPWQ